MVLTREKVIPGKLDMNGEELDIIVDFKILCERIINMMDFYGVLKVGDISKSDISELMEQVNTLYIRVGVDYSADKVIRRTDNDADIKD